MDGQMEGTNEQLAYTSVAGGIAFEAAKVGMQVGVWNNAYRLGKIYSFGLTKGGFKQRTSVEMLERFAAGEKVAGNIKVPFTGLPTGVKVKGAQVGQHINKMINGKDFASRGGFGFWKGEGGLLGSGKGLGYNIGFNKDLVKDMEEGVLDPSKLKGEISKLGKKKYVSNEELSGILNNSLNDDYITNKTMAESKITKRIEKYKYKDTVKSISDDLLNNHISAGGENITKSEMSKVVSESFFIKEKGSARITSNISEEGAEKVIKFMESKGTKLTSTEVKRLVLGATEKKAAGFIAKKAGKYGIAAGVAATGLVTGGVGTAVGAILATGFAVYDTVTTAMFANEASNEWIKSIAEENNSRVNPNLNPGARLNQNVISQSAASSGFQSLRSGSFGLSQLARKQNMASSYVDKMFGGTI